MIPSNFNSGSTTPTPDTAVAFATMLSAGCPPGEAVRYFLPTDEGGLAPSFVSAMAEKWLTHSLVQRAIKKLQGGDWTELTAEGRIRLAIDKHYTEMAYFLYSRNYVDLTGQEKSKADTCRAALEAKLAGTAGQASALELFWADVTAGRVSLKGATKPASKQAQPPDRGVEPVSNPPWVTS